MFLFTLLQPKTAIMAGVTVFYINSHTSLCLIFFKLKLQRCIQNYAERLRWSSLQKWLTVENLSPFLQGAPLWML